MTTAIALLLFLFLPTPLAQSRPTVDSKPLAITHVTVIDATGAAAQADMTVIIAGGRIVELGKTGKTRLPKNALVVNATGKYLIPGLWDMHIHLGENQSFLTLLIANGITGVRDLGSGPLEEIKRWRQQIDNGSLRGPRIIAAGKIVDGSTPIFPALAIAAGTEAEGRQAVRSLKQQGSDFVKVYDLLPRDIYFAVADEARKTGMVLAGHVPLTVNAAEASDAGQKSMEHLYGIPLACSSKEAELREEASQLIKKADPNNPPALIVARADIKALDSYDENKAKALFARFARNKTWQVPTFTLSRGYTFLDDNRFAKDPRLRYMPAPIRQWWGAMSRGAHDLTAEEIARKEKWLQRRLELVGAMRQSGVEILAGTDAPNPYCLPGFSLHDELVLLAKGGVSPMEVLQAATSNAAKYLGLLDSIGTVEKGKIADLVLLEANPLDQISNTQKIAAVILGGRLISKPELLKMLASVEVASSK
jgi:imidazolonepropionase-like amidohydrolase